jgi:hypothetical protein
MSGFGDPEGTFASLRTAAQPSDVAAYRTTPQFAVSLPKLAVMSLCTFGIYEVYWAYKQWDAQRRREQEELSPFWRAVFEPLWGFSLLPRLQRITAQYRVPATWSGSALATVYFVLHVFVRLPDPLWLVSLFSFVPLLIVQRSINALNREVAPDAPRNDSYSGLNVATIIVGGLLLLLAILGTLLLVGARAHAGGPSVAA